MCIRDRSPECCGDLHEGLGTTDAGGLWVDMACICLRCNLRWKWQERITELLSDGRYWQGPRPA